MLRGASLRLTGPRLAVLRAVHDHPHADTDSITGVVRERLGVVSNQAVYDVLRALTAAGLVRRIQPAGSVARYEARVGDNHHHLVCRSCGAIGDVDCAVGYTPCLTAATDAGYEIGEAEVIYWGRCPGCAAAAAAASGGRPGARGACGQQGSTAVDPGTAEVTGSRPAEPNGEI
jgi:Fur family transcriptional regulator, stress-responsive regulator